jgi:hypothetical protein
MMSFRTVFNSHSTCDLSMRIATRTDTVWPPQAWAEITLINDSHYRELYRTGRPHEFIAVTPRTIRFPHSLVALPIIRD